MLYAGWGSIYPISTGGVITSTDDGVTWSDLDSGQIGSSVFTIAGQGSLVYAGAGYVFYDIGDTNIASFWRSTDSGLTWNELKLKRGYEKLITLAVHGTEVFATTEEGVLRSDDSGNSWKVLTDSAFGPLSFAGGNSYLCTYYHGLLVSTDSGNHWNGVPIPIGTVASPLIVVKDSFIADIMGAVNHFNRNLDTGGFLAFSTDDGASWYENELPSGAEIDHLAFDGSRFYSATGTSVGTSWYSSDTGKSWESLTNMPDGTGGPNLVSSLFVSGDNLIASSQQDGIAYYPLSSLSVVLPSATIQTLYLSPNPTSGSLTIRGATGVVELMNVLGQVVLRQTPVAGAETAQFDLSKFPAGTYFARITTPKGIVIRKLLKE